MKIGTKKKLGVLGMVAAAVATVYAVKNRKVIAEKAEDVKEQGAMALHKRIGMPVYTYLKERNYIPF
tara:strand:- start:5209 stop:5409 length:201 start_codon:yes stop_codon:yes gene_type:complete